MDLVKLKEVWRVAKRLRKSGIPFEIVINQYARLPPKEGEPKASALGPFPTSFAKVLKLVEDLVQSQLLPADILMMQETNLESVIQV